MNADKSGEKGAFDFNSFIDQVKEVMINKASVEEVALLQANKANKQESECALRWIDLLHKMVKSIMQIYSMKLKAEVDMTGLESENLKQNRRVELLH